MILQTTMATGLDVSDVMYAIDRVVLCGLCG